MSLKVSLAAFLMTLLVAIPIRITQLMYGIDYSTGFYIEGMVSTHLLWPVIIIMCLLTIFLLLKNMDRIKNPISQRMRTLGVFQAILGFSIVYEAGITFGKFAVGIKIGFFYIMLDLLGIIAGFLMIVTGINMILGNLNRSKLVVPTLLPVMFYMIKMLTTFISYRTIVTISENLLNLLSSISICLFMFAYARLLCQEDVKKGLRNSLIFGVISGVITAVSTIPNIIVYFIKSEESLKFPALSSIAAALFVCVFVVDIILRQYKEQ